MCAGTLQWSSVNPVEEQQEDHREDETPQPRLRIPRADLLIAAAILALTIAGYYRVAQFDFVALDDFSYVYRNRNLPEGFTVQNLDWVLTSFDPDNWFPVTRLSYLIDYQFFGLRSGWYHAENVLIHAFASLLLFGFLRRATGVRWPSAFVAAVFAVHPLHVESVAWVSERKDELCALFWFATLWAWLRYTERPASGGRYLVALFLFALGLMSKPMIVTLPFLLVLLDLWPFRRAITWKTLAEKVPFFALSCAAMGLTLIAQKRAVQSLDQFTLNLRLENGLVAIFVYLRDTVWPLRLWVVHAYPVSIPAWQSASAAAGILAISALAVLQKRTRPWFIVGWFWFLGTLVPVIGIVQVGLQSRADRYMYVPMVGLLIVLAWAAAELVAFRPRLRTTLAVLGGTVCLCLTLLTRAQAENWDNTEVLFRHAIEMDDHNYLAWGYLALSLSEQPAYAEDVIRYSNNALLINPTSVSVRNNLAVYLEKAGRNDEAIARYREALAIMPRYAPLHFNLGNVLAKTGRAAEATREMETALRLDPENPKAHHALGLLLIGIPSRRGEGLEHLATAVRLKPDMEQARLAFGLALLDTPGRIAESVAHLREALRLDPREFHAYDGLAEVFARAGIWSEAIRNLQAAESVNTDPIRREKIDRLSAQHPADLP